MIVYKITGCYVCKWHSSHPVIKIKITGSASRKAEPGQTLRGVISTEFVAGMIAALCKVNAAMRYLAPTHQIRKVLHVDASERNFPKRKLNIR
jgi:hypothetical protein